MKRSQQILSGVLSLAVTTSICTSWIPNAMATDIKSDAPAVINVNKSKGEIALTVRFALPQTYKKVKSSDINLMLTNTSKSSNVTIPLENVENKNGDLLTTSQISVSKLDRNGNEISNENEYIGSYNIVLSGIELGDYVVTLTGDGYSTVAQTISLNDYSKHIIVSTDDGTFSLGDFDGNSIINAEDQEKMHNALGSTQPSDLAIYDLDGDGKIDITDLSYINQNKDKSGLPEVKDTAYIANVEVDTASIKVDGDQNISDIFTAGNTNAVKIQPTSEDSNEVAIPVTLSNSEEGVELSEIKITSPSTDGAVQSGTAIVELADGTQQEIPFGNNNVRAMKAPRDAIDATQNVISINLGKKVAVKKVTIKVTLNETGGYATVSNIEFIKDITSNISTEDTSKVKNLSALAGDAEVKLSWSSVNNVTGYTVYYGTSNNSLTNTLPVSTNNAVVTGLENNTTYYFQVAATSGDWEGTRSAVVSATPISLEIPGKPSDIKVEPADSSLRISWSKTKNATAYQVYYRKQGENTFTKFGNDIASTSSIITGLENGVTYEIAIKAGNTVGFGDYSAIAIGTPEKEGFKMPNLPADDRIDSKLITSIKMADSGNVNWSLCPNFNVNQLIDNDPNTYWIAKNYWYNSNITYTFSQPQDMNYALLVPYLDSKYKGRIDTYSVVAKDEEGNIVSQASGAAKLTSDNYIIITFPQAKNIKTLTISLGEKAGGPRVSISEMAFYKSSTLADDIANLFADAAFTKLADGVDLEKINNLETTLNSTSSYYMDIDRLRDEIALAKSLLPDAQPNLGTIKNDFQSRSTSADSQYGQSASVLQPIGVSAKAGSTIAIYADIPDGETVNIIPTQYYGESGVWQGSAIKLEKGRNYITIPKIGNLTDTRGGVLYLTYSGNNADKIKLQVRGNSTDLYQIPVLELSNWYNMSQEDRKSAISAYITQLQSYVQSISGSANLKTDIRNATEISTPSVLLSLPADQVLNGLQSASASSATGVQAMYSNVFAVNRSSDSSIDAMTETMYQNIMAWEEEMFVANKVQGIISDDADFSTYKYPMQSRQNIRYMRMFAGAFMYAAGNHIGVEYGSTSPLVQGKPTSETTGQTENGLFGWGIAHEIGHNMDKIGYAEITNNIYSLAMQAWDGRDMTSNTTRLTDDGRWTKIFDKVAQAREGMANDVFVQLGMYWQLHLAYDEADSPLKFYNQFFTKLKSGEYSGYTKDERIALIASDVANRDLSEFFTRWGMKLGSDALSQIQAHTKESRAIWYMNDDSRKARLTNASANNGTTTVEATANENTITLDINNTDSTTILGYEIKRNGVTIGFTTENTYTDNVGAANNLTYTYTVTPIDKLGNIGTTAKSNEVRVSYDKTISSDLYDMQRLDDGTIIIKMKDGKSVPVTGIKVTDANGNETNVKVEVQATSQSSMSRARVLSLDEQDTSEDVQNVEAEDDVQNSETIQETDVDTGLTNDNEVADGEVSGVPSDTQENEQPDLPESNEPNTDLPQTEQPDVSDEIPAVDPDYTENFGTWTVAKENISLASGDNIIYFNKPNVDSSDTRIWTYDTAVMKITGLSENANVQLLDYPGDKIDFYSGATVGTLLNDYHYGDEAGDVIKAGTLVIIGTYRGDPAYNYVEIQAKYNTTGEAQEANEVTTKERAMNGYGLMLAEIPQDGAVSDTSDGFFIYVPDLEAEKTLNKQDGVTDDLPLEIRAVMYRTDKADSTEGKRKTSETLWLGFPDEDSLPKIDLQSDSNGSVLAEVIR